MIRELIAAAAVAAVAFGTAPTAGADPISDLHRWTPAGFGPDNCQPTDPPGHALAMLHCSGPPGSPSDEAHFLLADSTAHARDGWQAIFDGRPSWRFTPVQCPGTPGGLQGTWPGGLIACGASDAGRVLLLYTNGPVLGTVWGTDLGALFPWWLEAARPG
jgi:hypothetical protein